MSRKSRRTRETPRRKESDRTFGQRSNPERTKGEQELRAALEHQPPGSRRGKTSVPIEDEPGD